MTTKTRNWLLLREQGWKTFCTDDSRCLGNWLTWRYLPLVKGQCHLSLSVFFLFSAFVGHGSPHFPKMSVTPSCIYLHLPTTSRTRFCDNCCELNLLVFQKGIQTLCCWNSLNIGVLDVHERFQCCVHRRSEKNTACLVSQTFWMITLFSMGTFVPEICWKVHFGVLHVVSLEIKFTRVSFSLKMP